MFRLLLQLSQYIILQAIQLPTKQQVLLLYQLPQKLHGFVDLFQARLAEGRPDKLASLSGVGHKSVSRHKRDVFLQASGHQHVVDIGHSMDFDPHKHSSSGNCPFADVLQVFVHGGYRKVTSCLIVSSHVVEVRKKTIEAPCWDEIVHDDLKLKIEARVFNSFIFMVVIQCSINVNR